MTTELKIVLIVSYVISGAIVYSRNYRLTRTARRILVSIPIVGIVYFLLRGKNPIDNSLDFGLLTGPIAVGLLYELLDAICLKLNKRSFHLHAVGAKDMTGPELHGDSSHYKWTDIFFSVILLLMWIGWPMLFVVIINLTTT